jgi:predicted Zn-dependent protease
LVGVTAAGSIVYGVYLGFLWFLGWTATQVPRSWEVELGRSAASDILSKAEVCTDPRLNRYMGKMADRLEKAIDEKPYDFRFKVVDRKSVNAFALPGGYVFVHSGLLRKAESGSEVAGVLAHEMQHVLKRHGMRRVVRKLGFWFALQLIFGNAGGLGDLLAQGAVKLGSLKYDRGQEDEADMEGVKQLYRAGMDPRGLPRFFKRLAKREEKRSSTEKALLPLLSSHPPSSYRQKRIMGYIKKRGLPENLRELKGYAEVKDLCEPKSFNKPDVDPPGMDGSGTTEKPAGRESAEPETPAARPRKARQ